MFNNEYGKAIVKVHEIGGRDSAYQTPQGEDGAVSPLLKKALPGPALLCGLEPRK
jgi:hypothetical protein